MGQKLAVHWTLLAYLEWSGLACLGLVLLLVGYFGVIFFSTALYAIALIAIAYSIWIGADEYCLYGVFGLLRRPRVTVAYILWSELVQYRLDIKAAWSHIAIEPGIPGSVGPREHDGYRLAARRLVDHECRRLRRTSGSPWITCTGQAGSGRS